ncbi:MAG: polysaccharide biosynthesis C-terminal domain-containing protein [Clostridia bacterium]|nr:polysaccharide biosynthesis C-terminal domain-containing protein [Clostridia bacterium]
MRKKSKLFLINGTILTVTSLLMKFASLVFNIYISNQIGSEAVGVFSLVMAVYLFFITVSTSGLNIAVTVIVSEKFAVNKDKIAIKAIRTCIFFSLLLGILAGSLILVSSNFITDKFLHNMVSSKPLFYIAIGLPFIAMSSCISSYFTSIRKAYKNAITQVFEFIIKIIATVILLKINISNGVEYICISLILADVISEVCSFSLIFILYIIDIKFKKLDSVRSFGQRINIVKIAFPVAITSYVRSGLSTLKQLIIPTQLEKSGLSCNNALSKYGIINGMVMPVITFPTVLINSYSMLLIPEFSTYVAQKNYTAINYISNKIFKFTCAFSVCICSIFLFFSNELGLVIYNNLETGYFFKMLAPLIFFMYMDNIIDCILKGLNKQFGVMCCNILDLSVTTCFIYFLLPFWGIDGYIVSIFISELLNFSVSLFQMIKYSKLKLNFVDWLLGPLFCSFVSYFVICIFNFSFVNLTFNLIANICLFVVVYLFTFCIFNKLLIRK